MAKNRYGSSGVWGNQRGVVMPMAAIGLLALLAMTGLALDGAHILISKTRLQGAVDAAALSAAKTLNATTDEVAAAASAAATFDQNAQAPGNSELAAAGAVAVTEYSATLVPFVPGSSPPLFVRVSVRALPLQTWLIQMLGFNTPSVAASAVAGPSPPLTNNVCKIAPMVLCGSADNNPNDSDVFGYAANEVNVVKYGAGQQSEVGPGNFQLIRLPGGQGAADVRDALAGAFEPAQCPSEGGSVPTEPGNSVGPVAQGLNTRFGQYSGPTNSTTSPPDWVTDEPSSELVINADGTLQYRDGTPYTGPSSLSYNYDDYQNAYAAGGTSADAWCSESDSTGRCRRRVLSVPVGNCDGTVNGQGDVPLFGFACLYLVQQVSQQGNEAEVFTQIVSHCDSAGQPSIAPSGGPLPSRIVLYKDPDSLDS